MSEENEMNNALGLMFNKMPDSIRVHVESCKKCQDEFESGFLKIMDEMKKDNRIGNWFDSFLKTVENHVGNIIGDSKQNDRSVS